MRTPVFQKLGLPRGFDCSAVSPLPFKDPVHTLAQASTCPVFAISAALDTGTKRSLSQGEFCQSGCIRHKKFCSRAFSDKREHKGNILLKNTRSVGEEVLSSSMVWVGFITLRSHFTELVS